MQITSPENEGKEKRQLEIKSDNNLSVTNQQEKEIDGNVQISQQSIDMLCKLFPNKKRSVLELVLKRCNHDLLKAIEHFNMNPNKSTNAIHDDADDQEEDDDNEKSIEITSAFKPVNNAKMKNISFSSITNHSNTSIPLLTGNKVFMHGLYPFLPLFNPQPVMPSPVYVPSFCECEQCKHSIYTRLEARQQI